jgi:hypothetical protein
LRETLDTRMCSSWKPRQVPWICRAQEKVNAVQEDHTA